MERALIAAHLQATDLFKNVGDEAKKISLNRLKF